MSIHQYIWVAAAFSIAKPFRAPIYTNIAFLISLIALVILNIYITFGADPWTSVSLLEIFLSIQ